MKADKTTTKSINKAFVCFEELITYGVGPESVVKLTTSTASQ